MLQKKKTKTKITATTELNILKPFIIITHIHLFAENS